MCYNDVLVYTGCAVSILSLIAVCVGLRNKLLHNAVAVEPFRCPYCDYCEIVHVPVSSEARAPVLILNSVSHSEEKIESRTP